MYSVQRVCFSLKNKKNTLKLSFKTAGCVTREAQLQISIFTETTQGRLEGQNTNKTKIQKTDTNLGEVEATKPSNPTITYY